MTIEGPVQQHVTRPGNEATGEARFFERAGEYDGGISSGVPMTRYNQPGLKILDSESNHPEA